MAIASLEIKPQVIPRGQDVVLNATISAAGPGVEGNVKCKIIPASPNASAPPEQTRQAIVPAGGAIGLSFTINKDLLAPGLYQVELRLETADNLAFDNVRYATFKIAEPRKVLAIADDPEEAKFWMLANEAQGEFDCEVKRPAELGDSLAKYEAVALLNVTDPSRLWPKLLDYVEAGGKLLILPGGEANVLLEAYKPAVNEAAARLLPAGLKAAFDTESLGEKFKSGVPGGSMTTPCGIR